VPERGREMQSCAMEMQLARESEHGTVTGLIGISEFGDLQFGDFWWEHQTTRQRAGRLAHITRTFNRYEDGLRCEISSLVGEHLSGLDRQEGSPKDL